MLAFVVTHFVSGDEDLGLQTLRSLIEPLSVQNWKTQRLTPVPKVLRFHAICTMADEHQSSIEKNQKCCVDGLTAQSRLRTFHYLPDDTSFSG